MIRIAPSLLSADFADLAGQIALAERGGADWLHLDVMDGHFVPNITFGPPLIRSVRKRTLLPLDAHLMIADADAYLEAFRKAGADIITVHVEACPDVKSTLRRIRELGAGAGVSINPATPVSLLDDVVAHADLILIMSVNPGFGGQAFMPEAIGKLREAAALIARKNPGVHLQVDGGIDPSTARAVVEAGANVLVAGKAIFGRPDIPAAIRRLRESAAPPRH